MTQKPFEIAIIGGGITGVTLAISLLKRNIRCTIYEQAPALGEIGAGLGIAPNARRAMKICDERIFEAFQRVGTYSSDLSGRPVWIDFLDGTSPTPAPELKPKFSIMSPPVGHGGVHRARFLDAMIELLPVNKEGGGEGGILRVGKRLDTIVDNGSGKLQIKFCDGTTAHADAVIGCDGVKSRTRELVVGLDENGNPKEGAKCGYSHKYAYRCMMPTKDVAAQLGEEKCQNPCLWMGPNRHVLTFPVNQGQLLNLVAFVTDEGEWPSKTNTTLPATRDEVFKDFEGFSENVRSLIQMTKDKSDRWGLFDLADNPLQTFYKGRVLVIGDAAHASTPHHGAGAGFCVEDVAILSTLLEDEQVNGTDDLEAVFGAFDKVRRERDQWLVRSSRRAAETYEWRNKEIGTDFEKMEKDINARQGMCWDVDLDKMLVEAREDLGRRLGKTAA
ncbi:salicylate 1-monooxygenase sala [Diplogelasinospora grovesii]|uniref:Salicylate 1-monooxygenase sala n=1 Tax=Diplogelasinospora grovesii TaxID=303347 RepID=A0AAN6N3R4_9PEZI|nr:salicylate 1-monooxygenase sala [Diplogelasinospora grovesii]